MSIEETGMKIRLSLVDNGIKVVDVAAQMGVSANAVSTFLKPATYAKNQARILSAIESIMKQRGK